MNPLVSILIPAYNSEKWIQDTVKSAMGQTWPKKEIIIVDDGSQDDTLRLAKSFGSKSVKVIAQENRGASFARNKALEFSQGDYIQWLDADDILHKDKIKEHIKAAENENNPRVLLTSSFGTFFFRTQKAIFRPSTLWQDLTPVEWMMKKFSDNIWMNPATWLVSRELTELAGPWDETLTWNDDGEYICRVVSVSEKVKFVPEAMCYYRIGNTNSLSSGLKRSNKRLISMYSSIVKQNSYLISLEDSKRTRASCLDHLQEDYIYFFPESKELMEKLNVLAINLGGELVPPRLKFKYSILQKMFGWGLAKNALFCLPKIKMLTYKYFEKHNIFEKS